MLRSGPVNALSSQWGFNGTRSGLVAVCVVRNRLNVSANSTAQPDIFIFLDYIVIIIIREKELIYIDIYFYNL